MNMPGFTAESCLNYASERAQRYNSVHIRNANVVVPQVWGGRPTTITPLDQYQTICQNCVWCWRKCSLWGSVCSAWRCSFSRSCCTGDSSVPTREV